MRKILLTAIVAVSALLSHAQKEDADVYKTKLGIKGGYNWSYVTASQSGINTNSKSGFMVGVFLAPKPSKGLGFRSEIVFSRQGYSFEGSGKNTDVLNDYIYLPQLTTYTIGKVVQLQLGAQIGFLLNSKLSGAKDSTITGLMNKVDYGFAGGVELHPVKGLLIGARYNLGLGKMYKKFEESVTNPYQLPFNPETTNMKNGVVQLFVGYQF